MVHGVHRDWSILAVGLLVLGWATNADSLEVSGSQSGTWALANSPYVARGVTVPTGQTLTIEAGVIVKFDVDRNYMLQVEGTLEAVGTSSAPIVFTSLLDDVGGDTNGDGEASSPTAGDWVELRFDDGSAGELAHCQIRYAGKADGRAVAIFGDAAPSLTHCEITHVEGDGVWMTGDAAPMIGPDNAFTGISGHGVLNHGSAMVDARNNWWGDASGPYHETDNPGGSGVEVSDRVVFMPFLTEPPGSDASTLVEAMVTRALPDRFTLFQNTPNPFNPATEIRFDLPAAADVRLSIYNIVGQEIQRLVEEHYPAGSYRVRWEADGRASGVYFYRLEARGFRAAKKMLVTR